MLNVLICLPRRFFAVLGLVIIMCNASTAYAKVHPSPELSPKRLAVVIDDFGNGMAGTEEMMALQIPFTAAVMPFLPTTKRDAEWAHRLGHNVIVHLPMEPLHGKSSWLGPGAITTNLSTAEIRARVNAAIDDVPYAVGINNHMGSKATADSRVMQVVLEVCLQRGLFFLDSRTNYRSVIGKISEQIGVKSMNNQIFLDEQYNTTHIVKQISRISTYFGKHDECIVIGHVGPPGKKTAEALKQAQAQLAKNIEFVSLQQMIAILDQKKLSPIFP
jgi:polysaccharide deacetylase 2 family uncharacterized protein YibQ